DEMSIKGDAVPVQVIKNRFGYIDPQADAAGVSYLGESKGPERDKKLLFYLMQHRHTTPFEMVEFKFRVKCPMIVARQWMRHRSFSFNEISRRYTSEEIEFYIPDTWRTQAESNKQASGADLDPAVSAEISAALRAHCESGLALYNNAINAGVAREMARLFLPHNLYTQFIAKIDAHNLMHFLELRMASDAQEEIRRYAWVIFEEFFKPALPWTAEAFEKFIIPTLGPLNTP
ncbi:MAG TPA: FAD-dependent thymidylate synthase, partial [Aggregatilineaceae bacterium]|nr:FAD-dependent thymidylate synthase [Aggregatilineaceae bacterium]